MMTQMMVNFARRIYLSTRSARLRSFYFEAFSRVVRNARRTATIDGITFELDLGETIDLAVFLRQYEHDVTTSLRRHCKAGMHVLDIGGNIGAHALPLAKLVGPTGTVVAFEPTEYAFRKLQRNLSLNDMPWARAVRVALSDREAKGQRIAFRSSWRTDGKTETQECLVDFVQLDTWASDNDVKQVDLIKMDVDGNEFGVLAGGRELLARCKPVFVMEAIGPHFADPTRDPFALLADLGYRFFDTSSDERPLSREDMLRVLPKDDWQITTSINVVARPLHKPVR